MNAPTPPGITAPVKTRPILFSAPMVTALLAGRKTQTRRLAKAAVDRNFGCPYGAPGDLLWVRETFSGPHCMEASEGCAAAPPSKWGRSSRIWYWADGNPQDGDWTRPRPAIHMPRWASRLTLRITDVRVQRLQDISEWDAIAEGIECVGGRASIAPWADYCGLSRFSAPSRSFQSLWESIHGPESWDANPWVWALSFDVLRGNIAQWAPA